METINIQCGHCRQVMAVSTAHMGMQVHCPHCRQIVQLPGMAAAGAAPAGAAAMQNAAMQDIPEINVPPPPAEPESIFTGPEEGPTDDLFGAPQRLVEMPPAAEQQPDLQPAPGQSPYGVTETFNPVPAVDHQEGVASTAPFSTAEEAEYVPPAADSAAATARARASNDSMKIPILLIFLIPYSVIATGFIAWLLYQNSKRFDPLIILADPDKNQPIRPKHDAQVPQSQKIKLNETIVVGDLEVTPQKVELTPEGELALHLKMCNKSKDLRFNPLPQSFLDFNPNIMTSPKPYTFLQTGGHFRFYGGNLDYWPGQPGQGQKSDGALNPGQAMTTLLHTKNDVTSLQEVKRLPQGKLVWRVQVRRGLMSIRGKEVSVTTVIGVEFDSQQIQRSGRPAS